MDRSLAIRTLDNYAKGTYVSILKYNEQARKDRVRVLRDAKGNAHSNLIKSVPKIPFRRVEITEQT